MKKELLTYLRKIGVTDVHQVNDIIVSQYRDGKLHLEDVIYSFEYVISPSDRVINGSIYTPKYIRQQIIHRCLDQFSAARLSTLRIADIACGCGGFLMDVAEYIHLRTGKTFQEIFRDNIYGIDIQDYSVERTKILLSLLALSYGESEDFAFNLIQADTLDFRSDTWNPEYTAFDVIVGNPPYVCSRNVSAETKQKMLQYEVSRSGHPDLYIPFFQIAIEMLNEAGVLGYITMNSFLRSVNGRMLREYFSRNRYNISIVDFRGYQVFPSKSTYTCLFFLHKSLPSDSLRYAICENGKVDTTIDYISVPYANLDNKKGWALNDFDNTLQQETVGVPLGKLCPSRHGIATLCNKVYIFKPIREDDYYFYFEDNKKLISVEKGICRDIVNSNKLNSEVEFATLIEKVIYPYLRQSDGRISVLPECDFISKYPRAYAYLQSHRADLAKRDKGDQSKYPAWYAYGRTQSLQMPRYKLFFPKFANRPIRCVLSDNPDLLLYNGVAFVSDSRDLLLRVKTVMESNDFWQYVVKNAKPYASDYFSVCGSDIKNYGVE